MGGEKMTEPAFTDKQKAFFLSLCLCFVNSMAEDEAQIKPKSARHVRMANLQDHCGRAIDIYRPDSWDAADCKKADLFFDRMVEQILELYPEEAAEEMLETVRDVA